MRWTRLLAVAAVAALGGGCAAQPQRNFVLTRHVAVPIAAAQVTAPAADRAADPAPAAPAPADPVDCSHVNREQAPLGDSSYLLDAWSVAIGRPAPGVALPGELFRIPISWPASARGLSAIGFEQPGNAAGLVFTSRGCVVGTWTFIFGGNGVELEAVESLRVWNGSRHHSLVLVRAIGRLRGMISISEDEQASNTYQRALVFAVDDASASLVFDTEGEQGVPELPVSLRRTGSGPVTLSMGEGPARRRFRYDEGARSFALQPR